MLRMRLMRNQYGPYIAAESAAALVSSGILVTIGYVTYGIITFMIFPHGAGTFTFADIAKVIGGTFWYGMDVSAMALVLSAFVTNEYVIVTVPFMIIYIIGVISNKVFSSTNIPEQVSRIVMAVSPEMLAVIGRAADNAKYIIIVHVIYMVICIALYYIIRKRRTDYGN